MYKLIASLNSVRMFPFILKWDCFASYLISNVMIICPFDVIKFAEKCRRADDWFELIMKF